MTVLAAIALVQCYATRTQDGCAPLSYHDTMAECRALAGDYRRVDTKALTRAGIPAIVSYRDQDNHPLLPEAPWTCCRYETREGPFGSADHPETGDDPGAAAAAASPEAAA